MKRFPYYLFASGLCLALAIGACSDGPTGVADEAALSADEATLSAKKPQFDICHWDGDANGGEGALVHLNVNGNSWDGGGEGCGGKENPHAKNVGHNGHELDANFNPDTFFVATECEAFCYEDRDDDGWTDDQDNCLEDFNPDQTDTDGDGEGDACDPDDDNDGVPDEEDNCPLVENPGQEDVDTDGFGAACDCDDENENVNPDATEVCNSIDDDCNESVDDGGVCDAPEACNTPEICTEFTEGCGDGDTCESHPDNPFPGTSYCFTESAGGGVCLGDFSCEGVVEDQCETSADCGAGFVCIVQSCCTFNTCVSTDLACGTPAPEAVDIVPRLFKGQVRTGSGR